MELYGEYLFLENFITGCVILSLTGRFCGNRRTRSGLLLGGLLCGCYSFVLFLPMHWSISLLSKLIFSAVVILATFGFSTKKQYLKGIGVFYAVSFLMGGITIAFLYLTRTPGVTANGAVYLHGFTWMQIAAGVSVTWFLGNWLVAFVKGKLQRDKVFTDVDIELEQQKWQVRAFVDTGNFLKEPISGTPAAVLSASCGRKIMQEAMALGGKDALDHRRCVIPYRSIGNKGLMEGFRPDRIIVEGKPVDKIVLAVSNEDFKSWRGEERYEILLQQQIIERGNLEYAE